MVVVKNEFGTWDYVVFAAMLVISIAIGLYFALMGGKQKTQGEYLMANRNMSIVPVAISILLSFMSAILMLGTPAEMYTQGTEYYLGVLGMCLGIPIAALLFVPLIYPLKITSVFEYLEKRYQSRAARLTGTFLMILTQITYMGIATFAPSTALEAVTGFPVWGTIIMIGAVGTFYTSIGGMKAVVWTDVFQSVVMLSGMLAIAIQGTIKVGGFSRVWEINETWRRLKFFNFDPNPTTRHTVWGLVIGGALNWIGTYGINQASVQRYSSLPSLSKAKMSVLLNMIGIAILMTVACYSGIVLFAYYAEKNCDPLGQKIVDNSNQLIPYFVMETLGYPGVPGLFIASLFSGALSSVSSSLNALAAITWEDILKPRYDQRLTETQKTAVTKIIVGVYGCLAIGTSFVAKQLEGTVLQAAISFIGAAAGPLTGMFILGAFFPWPNKYGAITGAVCGLAVSLWLSIGAYSVGISLPKLTYPNGTCSDEERFNWTTTITSLATTTVVTTTRSESYPRSGLGVFYSISYLWYSSIGLGIVVIVGLIVSFLTGANSKDDIPTKYQIPIFTRLFCYLPDAWLYKLNCYRHFQKPQDIQAEENGAPSVLEEPNEDTAFSSSEKKGISNSAFENGKV